MGPGPISARKHETFRASSAKLLTRTLSRPLLATLLFALAGPLPAQASNTPEPALNGWLAVPLIILVLAAGLFLQSSLRRFR